MKPRAAVLVGLATAAVLLLVATCYALSVPAEMEDLMDGDARYPTSVQP
jgi:hypothetical protein